MSRQEDKLYESIRKNRIQVRPIRVTFAYGQQLTGIMDLSIRQLESMLRQGDITNDARCIGCCDDKPVTECPAISPYLLEWPTAPAWLCHADGLVSLPC